MNVQPSPLCRGILAALGACLLAVPAGPCRAEPGGPLRLEWRDFGKDGRAAGWSAWAARDEIRPLCTVDTTHYRSAPDALAIFGNNNPGEYGGWACTAGGVRAGQYYRLRAYYRTESVADERRQVVARLDWRGASGERVGQPDYAYEESADGDWNCVTASVPAPPGATSVRIELSLGWAPRGTVWWDDITLEETKPPAPRWVRVGTVSLHPRNDPDNLGAYLRALDRIAQDKPDIVCLGEEILVEGSSRAYADAAEPIPGPSTTRLGERARKYGMYIVAGLTERDGRFVYNTAVLIDRHGEVAGRYRKVYLPREEIEGGMTPGGAYPVFETDFGKIGLMICWDNEYVDGARAMAFQGAEILFVPAAGGYLTLLKARALENHLYVVSSGYDVESAIIDPTGEVLFSTMESGVTKTVSVNLAERFTDPWLGDMRPRFHKEIRGDIPVPGLSGR
jgi:predicted amidohydrolase